ncbi:MAG TPA: DUF4252 domain-containing protein [Pyrinomonadaceae bacterium]|nr:DUF4252 domain-containing protein [Pyrinomonadaceae bacterium]
MKTALRKTFVLGCLALAATCAGGTGYGQQPSATQARARVQLETLERLAARAEKSVDVSIDAGVLGLAKGVFAKPNDEKARKVAEAIKGLEGVYVRVYEFASEGQWGESDIADIRRQVKETGWSNVVNVRNRAESRTVEVHLRAADGKIGGLVVLSTEPKQLVVVNMIGDIDVQKLASLQGQFGIPEIDLRGDDDDDKDRKAETKPAAKKP